jgi:hypothetical protein
LGRPIGSVNREKPVSDLLRVAVLSGGGRRVRVIVEKLLDKAEQGDLQAIREVMDRLDGKPTQAIEPGDASVGGDDRPAAVRDHSRRITRAVRRTESHADLRAKWREDREMKS